VWGSWLSQVRRPLLLPLPLPVVQCASGAGEHRGVCVWACAQVVRVWAGASHADVEYTVGPIPWDDGWGKEVVTTYTTNLTTDATWWTDSNGRDSVVRRRNYRSSYNYTVYQNVSGESARPPCPCASHHLPPRPFRSRFRFHRELRAHQRLHLHARRGYRHHPQRRHRPVAGRRQHRGRAGGGHGASAVSGRSVCVLYRLSCHHSRVSAHSVPSCHDRDCTGYLPTTRVGWGSR